MDMPENIEELEQEIENDPNVIRNPARQENFVDYQKYIPEHIRLNSDVIDNTNEIITSGLIAAQYDEKQFNFQNNGHFIDNNEEVSFFNGQATEQPSSRNVQIQSKISQPKEATTTTPLAKKPSSQPAIGEYILMFKNKVVQKGNLELIEQEVNDLISQDNEINSIDDIVVLKRVSIKVGVFVGE